ncbi:unnamed protein product [Polarella glacialis]|uniref:SH3 domain-containing protein n=1 Tax=Polarella glacialis TaxID=89957 RepID=A0A813KJ56_POLGL|nr:unnamed protein product [Polarella glacialis]
MNAWKAVGPVAARALEKEKYTDKALEALEKEEKEKEALEALEKEKTRSSRAPKLRHPTLRVFALEAEAEAVAAGDVAERSQQVGRRVFPVLHMSVSKLGELGEEAAPASVAEDAAGTPVTEEAAAARAPEEAAAVVSHAEQAVVATEGVATEEAAAAVQASGDEAACEVKIRRRPSALTEAVQKGAEAAERAESLFDRRVAEAQAAKQAAAEEQPEAASSKKQEEAAGAEAAEKTAVTFSLVLRLKAQARKAAEEAKARSTRSLFDFLAAAAEYVQAADETTPNALLAEANHVAENVAAASAAEAQAVVKAAVSTPEESTPEEHLVSRASPVPDWAEMKLELEIQPGQRVLSLKDGDVITVLNEDIDPGWYLGELNGRRRAQGNYVEKLPEEESPSVPEPSPSPSPSPSVLESLHAAAEEPLQPLAEEPAAEEPLQTVQLSLSAEVPSPQAAASSSSAAMAKALRLLAKPKSETAAPGRVPLSVLFGMSRLAAKARASLSKAASPSEPLSAVLPLKQPPPAEARIAGGVEEAAKAAAPGSEPGPSPGESPAVPAVVQADSVESFPSPPAEEVCPS